jgi:DNA-binding MarR family transcriptional regulator
MSMARLVRQLSYRASQAVEDAERISLSEMTLLGQVRALGGSARMVDLAERLHVTRAAVTKIADSLEQSELLRRSPDPGDRRVVRLSLTDAGVLTLARAEAVFESFMKSHLWDHLSEQETASTVAVLRRVEVGLKAEGRPFPPR